MSINHSYLLLEKELQNNKGTINSRKSVKKEIINIYVNFVNGIMLFNRKRKLKCLIKRLEGNINNFKKVDTLIEVASDKKVYGNFNINELSITIYDGLGTCEYLQVLIHEIAHMVHYSFDARFEFLTKSELELIAESVSFIVCNLLGISDEEHSVNYIKYFEGTAEMLKNYKSLIIQIVLTITATLEEN